MRVLIIQCCFLIAGMANLYAQANDPFHENEIEKLLYFLNQESEERGVKNFQQLGLSSINDVNWWAVPGMTWNIQSGYLERLDWSNRKLSGDLDLSGFIMLTNLNCSFNDIRSVNIKNSSLLQIVDFYQNDLFEIDLSTNPNLYYLRLGYNNIRRIDLSNNPNLGFFCCTKNQVESLDFSNKAKLYEVTCLENKLHTLRFENCTLLEKVVCDQNLITSLNLYNVPKLKTVSCMYNLLKELKLYNCTSLQSLNCFNNEILKLDVSSCENLTTLDCRNNQLNTLNVKGCKSLTSLVCENNMISELDIKDCPLLTTLTCMNNCFTFLTLPIPSSQFSNYLYSPQFVTAQCEYNNIDFSDFYNINGINSTYFWRYRGLNIFPLKSEEGRFAFNDSYIGESFICWVMNTTFPQLVVQIDVTLMNEGVGNPLISASNKPVVYASEGTIHVVTDKPVKADIYSLQGVLQKQMTVNAGYPQIPVERGIYMVVIDNMTPYKVIVR